MYKGTFLICYCVIILFILLSEVQCNSHQSKHKLKWLTVHLYLPLFLFPKLHICKNFSSSPPQCSYLFWAWGERATNNWQNCKLQSNGYYVSAVMVKSAAASTEIHLIRNKRPPEHWLMYLGPGYIFSKGFC